MKQRLQFIFLTACVGIASGCAEMPKNWARSLPWAEKPSQMSESKYQAPVKMVALWSPAMYSATGKPAARGFGGRLYFYNAKNETIPVEGQLVVYGFDDTTKDHNHKKAKQRFAYTPEQFSGHFSPTELGASYSIWIPWDAVGNSQAEVSLLPIFTSASGQVVVGQQSLGLLPGPESPTPETHIEKTILQTQVRRDDHVQGVAYQEAAGSAATGASSESSAARGSGIDTFSITLPQSMAERMVAPSQMQTPALLPSGQTLPTAQPLPLVPSGTETGDNQASKSFEPARGPTSAAPSLQQQPLFQPLAPLTHSVHSQPQARASQHPGQAGGPAPMQRLPAAPASSQPR